jgi:hypothetical protein
MSHGCVVVALVLEDVHYGVFKLVVYQRWEKMWNASKFKWFFSFCINSVKYLSDKEDGVGWIFYYGRSLTSGDMTFCCIKYFKGVVEKEVISR